MNDWLTPSTPQPFFNLPTPASSSINHTSDLSTSSLISWTVFILALIFITDNFARKRSHHSKTAEVERPIREVIVSSSSPSSKEEVAAAQENVPSLFQGLAQGASLMLRC
jgi:hypothetical protein